jgi:hypothetical protein
MKLKYRKPQMNGPVISFASAGASPQPGKALARRKMEGGCFVEGSQTVWERGMV